MRAAGPGRSVAVTRQGGYRAALDEAGIAWNQALVAHGDMTFESGDIHGATTTLLVDSPQCVYTLHQN